MELVAGEVTKCPPARCCVVRKGEMKNVFVKGRDGFGMEVGQKRDDERDNEKKKMTALKTLILVLPVTPAQHTRLP